MGVLVLSGALLEAYALLQVTFGGNEYVWRIAALALPLLVFVVLIKTRHQVLLASDQDNVTEGEDKPAPSNVDQRLALLKECPSVANKVGAADELMRCGRFDEAVPIYESALTGIYSNEPDFLYKLAQSQIESCAFSEASVTVARLTAGHERYRPEETRLLHARVLEGQGHVRAALNQYESLSSAYVGLEARCRFGLLLMREGQIERANAVFMQMVKDAEHSSYAQRVEHHWLRVAAHCQARLQAKLAPVSGAR